MITLIAAIILMSLVLLLSVGVGMTVLGLHKSDPAGNGFAMAYAVIGMVVLWLLVGVMLLVTCGRRNPELVSEVGRGPLSIVNLAVFAAFVAAAPSQFAFLRVLDARRSQGALAAVIRVSAIASPLLLVFHSAWRTFAWARDLVPPGIALWGVLGLLVVLCAVPWPEVIVLTRRVAQGKRQKRAARDLIDMDVEAKPSQSLTEGRRSDT
ncbi:MAG: hypothetical protein H7210_00865 [Pyrinomonadaceae bacterium]|nr:hypothetical protein [Phycisphaerales bacterium]